MRLYLKSAAFCAAFLLLWRLSDRVDQCEAYEAWFQAQCWVAQVSGGDPDAFARLSLERTAFYATHVHGWTDDDLRLAVARRAVAARDDEDDADAEDAITADAAADDDDAAGPTTAAAVPVVADASGGRTAGTTRRPLD